MNISLSLKNIIETIEYPVRLLVEDVCTTLDLTEKNDIFAIHNTFGIAESSTNRLYDHLSDQSKSVHHIETHSEFSVHNRANDKEHSMENIQTQHNSVEHVKEKIHHQGYQDSAGSLPEVSSKFFIQQINSIDNEITDIKNNSIDTTYLIETRNISSELQMKEYPSDKTDSKNFEGIDIADAIQTNAGKSSTSVINEPVSSITNEKKLHSVVKLYREAMPGSTRLKPGIISFKADDLHNQDYSTPVQFAQQQLHNEFHNPDTSFQTLARNNQSVSNTQSQSHIDNKVPEHLKKNQGNESEGNNDYHAIYSKSRYPFYSTLTRNSTRHIDMLNNIEDKMIMPINSSLFDDQMGNYKPVYMEIQRNVPVSGSVNNSTDSGVTTSIDYKSNIQYVPEKVTNLIDSLIDKLDRSSDKRISNTINLNITMNPEPTAGIEHISFEDALTEALLASARKQGLII